MVDLKNLKWNDLTFIEMPKHDMNIEARYPEYKTGIACSLNEQKWREIIDFTKQMQQWIIQKFSPATKPSGSSATTSE